MAARKMTLTHQDDVRRKIQASQLVNVLQAHALTGEGEFSMTRMKAIEILLRKSIADLSAITISGDANSPLTINAVNMTPEEFARHAANIAAKL